MNIFWEIDERRFVAGLSDPRVLNLVEMPAGDLVPLRIYIVERSSIADLFSTVPVASGSEIVVSAKATAASTSSLFLEDEFEETGVGTYTYYSGELDLNTEEIAAALGTKATVTVIMEIAWRRTADDAQSYSTTIRLKLHNNIINISDVPVTASANIKFINNVLHIRNETTGLWHPVVADGAIGEQHFDLGEGS